MHATESYFMTGEMGNPPQLEHLILYSEEEEVVESFAGLIKDGLKTLGLGRDAKLLLSNIEPLQTVTKLDLDSADDSLDILNFPNLKKLTIGSIDDALVLKSLDIPLSLEELHIVNCFEGINEDISSFILKLPLGLKKLTLHKFNWF